MKRFVDLNVVAGDTVMVVADCQMKGAIIAVPKENVTNVVTHQDAYVAIENRSGKLSAWHTGCCFGDPDQWEMAS